MLCGHNLWHVIVAVTVLVSTSEATAAANNDFDYRCSRQGVLKCVSFDTDADFSQGRGGTQGAWGSRFGLIPRYGTSDYSRATRDTTQAADGASSLRFTIASNSSADVGGAWFTNFTDDLSYQVGEGQEIFVQWRQRFSPELLSTRYLNKDGSGALAGGWKLADISGGDLAGCSPTSASSMQCPTTCWDGEVVVQDTDQHNLAELYTNCAGSFPYIPLLGYTSNYTVQNVVNCTFPNYPIPPCIAFQPNQWMTFQLHIKVGHWNQWDSTVQLWIAREGVPSTLIIDCSPSAQLRCSNGRDRAADTGWYLANSDATYKYGKVWLLPYHTNKDPTQVTATAYTWYDDLIISTSKIPDPAATVRPNSPSNFSKQ